MIALGDVVTVIDCEHRTAPKTDSEPFGYSIGTRAVRSGKILLNAAKPVSEDTYRSWTRRAEPLPGDLIFSREAPMGEVGIVPRHARVCLGQRTVLLKLDTELVERQYLLYMLMAPQSQRWITSNSAGSTVQHLNVADVRKIPLPLVPPVQDQRRIVGVLEDHLSRLDAARNSIVDGKRKLDALWLAWLSGHRRTIAGCNQRAIGEIAETALGKMLDSKKQRGTPTAYLRNINVRWRDFDLSDVSNTLLTAGEVLRFDVRSGDVMVCEGGEPGRCAVWRGADGEYAYQKALHRVRIRDEHVVLPDFLALMLEEAIRSGRCSSMFTGTTIKHLPQEKLRAIPMPVPAMDIQRQLVRSAADILDAQTRLRTDAVKLATHSEILRRSLLAAAFSGRLTNSSNELLKELESV